MAEKKTTQDALDGMPEPETHVTFKLGGGWETFMQESGLPSLEQIVDHKARFAVASITHKPDPDRDHPQVVVGLKMIGIPL